jgi:RNA polymerase sigma-70 factor (ECF subfamily)
MRNNFAGFNSILPTTRPWPGRDNSDETLIAKIASGNRLAMQVLYARYHTRVHRFLLRWTGNAAIAEDLTADVFLSAWRHADRFDGSSTVSTSLIAIARRKAESELRRRPQALSNADDEAIIDLVDDREIVARGKDDGEGLRQCLMRLTREHREIIDLVYYHGKSEQETARIVGISCNEVRSRMLRARTRLSELAAAKEETAYVR